MPAFKNKTGLTFGRLYVIGQASCVRTSGGQSKIRWHCLCDCGNEVVVRGCNLSEEDGHTRSCGCLLSETSIQIGKRSMLVGGFGELTEAHWRQIIRHASSRELSVGITRKQAWYLFLLQHRKCALSGLGLSLDYFGSGKQTASLDRKDSTRGYTLANIQWVHKDLNRMKWDLPEAEFIKLCKSVANYA